MTSKKIPLLGLGTSATAQCAPDPHASPLTISMILVFFPALFFLAKMYWARTTPPKRTHTLALAAALTFTTAVLSMTVPVLINKRSNESFFMSTWSLPRSAPATGYAPDSRYHWGVKRGASLYPKRFLSVRSQTGDPWEGRMVQLNKHDTSWSMYLAITFEAHFFSFSGICFTVVWTTSMVTSPNKTDCGW